MIEIEYNFLKSKIYNLPPDIMRLLVSRLTFTHPGKKWIVRNNNSGWDGQVKYYTKNLTLDRGICITVKSGLLHKVMEVLDTLESCDASYGIKDITETAMLFDLAYDKPEPPLLNKIIKYEPHQIEAFKEMLSWRRGILCSPTGSGKTETALSVSKYLIDTYLEEGECILFLTHRDVVYEDVWNFRIKERFPEAILTNTIDRKSAFKINNCWIITAMAQTFASRIGVPDGMDGIIRDTRAVFVDEVHAASTYIRKVGNRKINILDKLKNCEIRWGLSATPFKDKTGYTYHEKVKDFGAVLNIPYESPVKVKVERLSITLSKYRGYPDSLKEMERNPFRNAMIATVIKNNPDRKFLILVSHLEQGRLLSKMLNLPFIEGNTLSRDRSKIIKEIKLGKVQGVVATSVYYFGVDIPSLDMIILASIGKSYINVIQAIGRGMRKFKGKNDLKVIDFTDEDKSFMQKHSKLRMKHYKEIGYEVIEK